MLLSAHLDVLAGCGLAGRAASAYQQHHLTLFQARTHEVAAGVVDMIKLQQWNTHLDVASCSCFAILAVPVVAAYASSICATAWTVYNRKS